MVEGGNKNVNELSKKLLDGWVLISDSCPNSSCSVPLVKSKTGEIYCIGCERHYELGDSPGRPHSPMADHGANDFELSPEKEMHPPRTYSTSSSPYNQRAAPFAPPPLPPHSPHSPQMHMAASQSRSPMHMEQYHEPSPDAGAQPLTTHYSNSAEIAQKLLQGWVLMSDYCTEPGCNLPLVKNQEGMLQCVACKRVTHMPSQAAVEPPRDRYIEPPSPAARYSHQPSPAASHRSMEQSQLSTFTPQKQRPALESLSPSPGRGPSDGLRLATLDTNDAMAPWSQIAHPTEALLMQKIGAARRQLQGCTDVNDSKALCSLIAEAANALKAIKSIAC